MTVFLIVSLMSLFLSGCASTALIPSHQESNVDASIDDTTPILVVAKDGSDTLISKRFYQISSTHSKLVVSQR